MNFLKETMEVLDENGKKLSDIKAIQFGDDFGIPVEDFTKLADFEYDNGYGCAEIPTNLIIIGDGWWLERGEYDGSEWWEFKTQPTICKTVCHIYSFGWGGCFYGN